MENTSIPSYQPPSPSQPPSAKTSKMMVMGLVVGAAVLAVLLWWWTSRSDQWAEPEPLTPTQDADVSELNELNADVNLDADFQEIDQDLNSI